MLTKLQTNETLRVRFSNEDDTHFSLLLMSVLQKINQLINYVSACLILVKK
jgi:hypothetical protein